jgi:hypothetical protein
MAVTFDCTNDAGEPIVISTKWKDLLTSVVKTQGDGHELASRILEFYSQELAVPQPTELDRVAQLMIAEMHAGDVWRGWSRLVEVKQKDGVRLTLVNDHVDHPCLTETPTPVTPRPISDVVEDDPDLLV